MTAPSCPRCGFDLAPAPPPPAPLEPREPRKPRVRLAAASVPRILLGLGAGCVLVGAVLFLAVAWSTLGVGGRTAVLVSLTALSAVLGEWLARRDLRVGAEALTVVAFGLLTLDAVGARDAGWVDVRLDVLVGAALLTAGLGLLRRLTAQVLAPVGLALLAVGAGDAWLVEPAALTALLGCVALSRIWSGRPLLPWGTAMIGAIAYLVLLVAAALRAAPGLSLAGLWLEGRGWWLLLAAALPLAHRYGRPLAAVLLTVVMVLPVVDTSPTVIALVAVAALAGWGLLVRRWSGAWAPVGAAALVLLPVVLLLTWQTLERLAGESPDPVAHPLVLPLAAAAAAIVVRRSWRLGLAMVWLAGAAAVVLLATDVRADWLALGTIAAAGLLALAVPRLEAELPAWSVGLGALAAAGGSALDLTLAGIAVTASAVAHCDRRVLGWPGGLLLAAATWVRLADLGVEAPEAYSLPSALVLVGLGLLRLRRDRDTDSLRVLLPGLTLATVPSLLWVLDDPLSPRAIALGLACLALLLIGTAVEWSAPLLVGAIVGGLLVLRELAPYAAATPQWVLIGTAGTVLIAFGVTWEARLRELRAASGYLGRLR